MSAVSLFCLVFAYFALLLAVAWRTSRNATNDSFFIGNKRSNWMLVAFGMVGTTLSGVTFISVPGAVGRDGFGYLQVILGYVLGYIAVAYILLPLYYRLKLTSIYSYLDQRLGHRSYQSGAAFFILSRTLSASARLYLVVNILQATILDSLGVPFWLTTLVILTMILLYTYEGGVRTIVWTDTLQTAGMLLGLVICAGWLLGQLDLSLPASLAAMEARGLTHVVTTSVDSPAYFWKQLLAGFFIVLAMTGMDQEIMQKNISVQTLRDSQKNMLLLTVILTGVLLLFMFLGGLLSLYAPTVGLAATGDKLFPAVVMQHMPAAVQLIFFIGLVSALFPSADGAMTALTSSFCIDILGMQRRADLPEAAKVGLRHRIHLGFGALFLLLVLLFKWLDNASMIGLVLKLTGYTYGPLLGLFAFGILTRRSVRDRWVPLVALAGPTLCYVIDYNQQLLFGSYRLGLELLIMNGLLVFTGLLLISKPRQ
ncbi:MULTISPECIES: sodium:solute symporter [unclassified Duganella]|uniref:sodium:solute symporter n=1 Tax=unclassified Duganella TaxID=2636909 RepID=UPI000E34DE0A|nr:MULTISPECIES: sodium:solute symporter [unclassified Duganella]RFP18494.1 sodium:solute symporter [Duganella sp. BJB475]RFP35160.1 sodium:solute symporter [Duganella sp. BJB476]